MDNKYISGQCNIGKYESEKRLRIGVFGILLSCCFSFLFYVFAIDKFIIFICLFPSIFTSIIGILQYKNKFCVYYGITSFFNFESIDLLQKVENLNDIQKDKQKSLKLIAYSLLGALIYSIVYIILI